MTSLEKKQRGRIKLAISAVIIIASAFFLGMLIQGCNSAQMAGSESSSIAATPSNVPTLKPATNVPALAATNAPAPPPVAAPVSEPQFSGEPVEKSTLMDTLYVVRRGDTLTRLARTYGTTVRLLKAENGLKSDRIVVGQQLKIPPAPQVARR